MRAPALRIRHKIAIPFTALFLVTTLGVAFLAISLISSTLDRRLTSQIEHASEVISKRGFALNASILAQLKLILGAEVVTYQRRGTVLVTTVQGQEGGTGQGLIDVILAPEVAERIFDGGEELVVRDLTHQGRPYRVAYRPLLTPQEILVALIVPTAEIAAAKRATARTLGVIALLTVGAMALLSQLIARSITSPVQSLVASTKRLAAGDLNHEADVRSRDEIGQLADAFNEMVRRLRASEEELLNSEKLSVTGQLAAHVAHDVRNPLSSIKMQAQLLRNRSEPGDTSRESLDAILRQIDNVERVVEGLLDLSRPAELRRRPCGVNEVLTEALKSAEAMLRHRKIEVATDLASDLPRFLLDPDRMHTALLNLIANAADALPDGGTLSAATHASGDAIQVEIADDGLGIAPELLDKLFDPFFTTKRDGVGLGLLSTKGIVEAHGGHVELKPAPERGTRAIITLPLVDGRDEP